MTKIWSKEVLSYAFYDFANSSYALLILTFAYGLYFKAVVLQNAPNADFLWGIVTAVPVIVAAVLSPLLGAIADYLRHKKLYLILSTLATVILTALLVTVGKGEVAQGMVLVILASTFYYFSTLFYDAFIVDVADRNSIGKISGFAWGFGYVGGVAALALAAPFVRDGLLPENVGRFPWTFILTAVFFLVFALPMFFFVKQKTIALRASSWTQSVSAAFHDLLEVWKHRKLHRNFFLLVLAFFFYNDGLSTLFAFVAIFANFTIGMSAAEITTLLFAVQVLAFPSSWFFGALADILGQKPIIMTTLSIVLIFSGVAALSSSPTLFFIAVCLASLGIGASQSSTRALIRKMIPEDHAAQFFGFQSFLGKFSAFLGPLLFGYLSSTFDNQRVGFIAIALFLIIGMIVLTRVKVIEE